VCVVVLVQDIIRFYELRLTDVIHCAPEPRLQKLIDCIRARFPSLSAQGMRELGAAITPVPDATEAQALALASVTRAQFDAKPAHLVQLFVALQVDECAPAEWLKYDLDRDGRVTEQEIDTVYQSWTNQLQAQYSSRLNATSGTASAEPFPYARVLECMRGMLSEVAVIAVHTMSRDPVRGFTRAEFAAQTDVIPPSYAELRAQCEAQAKQAMWWSRYDLDKSGTITVSEVQAVYRSLLNYARTHTSNPLFADIEKCVEQRLRAVAEQAVKALDKDGDGGVQRSEFQAQPNRFTADAEQLFRTCEDEQNQRQAADALFRVPHTLFSHPSIDCRLPLTFCVVLCCVCSIMT
jgi:Ca2+-binding EF-hand superfamily protein